MNPHHEPPRPLGTAGLTLAGCAPQMMIKGDLVRLVIGEGPDWREPGCPLRTDRIVIGVIGGRMIYRVGAYHPDTDEYDAEWPD